MTSQSVSRVTASLIAASQVNEGWSGGLESPESAYDVRGRLGLGSCRDNCFGIEKKKSSANYNGPCKGHCDGIGLTTGAVEYFCHSMLQMFRSDKLLLSRMIANLILCRRLNNVRSGRVSSCSRFHGCGRASADLGGNCWSGSWSVSPRLE